MKKAETKKAETKKADKKMLSRRAEAIGFCLDCGLRCAGPLRTAFIRKAGVLEALEIGIKNQDDGLIHTVERCAPGDVRIIDVGKKGAA